MSFNDNYAIVDNYLVIKPHVKFNKKKIMGHSFVELAGISKYNKRGDQALERLGLKKAKKIDPKWLKRGTLAENIVQTVYKRNHEVVVYDKFEIGFDNFKENNTFGGLIDIDIPSEEFLIEVKSKSLNKYDDIVNNQPMEEVYQGLLYGVLRNYKKIVMVWIFFDSISEEEVFRGLMPKSLKNIKKFEKEYILTPELINDVRMQMDIANDYLTKCEEERRIPLSDISDEALKEIGY